HRDHVTLVVVEQPVRSHGRAGASAWSEMRARTVTFVLQVDSWPELRDPLLVIALSGWVDAGVAAGTAAATLRAQLAASRAFARLDLADLVDLQQTRPQMTIIEGTTRGISWPVIEFVAGRAGRDVVVCTGPEPSLRWPSVIAEVAAMARRLGVV